MKVVDARPIAEISERFARMVSTLDFGAALPATCKDVVALAERIERTARTLKSLAAAKVAETVVWQGEGDRSAEDWLARTTGTSRAEAVRELQTGRQLHALPEVAEVAASGAISVKQTEAIAGAAAVDPSATGRLLESARSKGLGELQRECRTTRANADPDPEATRARIHARRSYRTWNDPDGTGHLHLSGPMDTIARADNAIRHRGDQIFCQARKDGRREPGDAYGFDAAVDLLTNAGDTKPVPRGADAKIIVRVDLPALIRGRAVAGEVCEIAGCGTAPGLGGEGLDAGRVPGRGGHQGHRDRQGHPSRSPLQEPAAHRAAVARPDLRPEGLLQPAWPRVRPLRRLGAHPNHPHHRCQAVLPHLPRPQERRLAGVRA